MIKQLCYLIAVFAFDFEELNAQLNRREISFGLEYLTLIDNNKLIYADAPVYRVSLLWGKKPKKKIANWYGFAFTYMNQPSVSDTLYYVISSSESGYSSYGDREAFQILNQWKWDTAGKRPWGLQYGVDVGFHFESYTYEDTTPDVHSTADVSASGGVVAPFLGFRFNNKQGLGAFLQSQYQFVFASDIWNSVTLGGGISFIF